MGEKNVHGLALVERDTTQLAPVVASALEMLRLSPPETVAAAMDKILAVQERYEAGEARKAFAAAIVAAKRDLPAVIGYDAQNKFAGYRYSTLAAIVDGITKALSRNDLSVSWDVSSSAGNVTVVCKITHCAGHVEISSPMTTPVENTTSAAGKEKKTPAMAIMSAATSLRRMTVMAMLGLSSGEETSDEADGEVDVTPARSQVVTEPVRSVEPDGESVDDMMKRWKAALFLAKTPADCDRIGGQMGQRLQEGTPIYTAALALYNDRKRDLKSRANRPTEEPREGEIVAGGREPGADDGA
jgi:hypothetical protein